MPPKRKGNRKTEAPRFEANEIPPSTLPSHTRYDEFQSHDYPERDEVVWTRSDSMLTEDEIAAYFESSKHLKRDTALPILRESGYDISAAVDRCAELVEIPDLSLLEKRVLLAASPVPYTVLDGASGSWIDSEKHIRDLLPLVQPSVIRDYYIRIGRETCMPPSGWLPKADGLGSTRSTDLVTQKNDSQLYKQQERGRSLRSSTITPVLPREVGTRSIDRRSSLTPIKSRDSPPEKRGRTSNRLPIHPSPLILGESSLRSPFLSHEHSAADQLRKKRKDPLEIAMNWSTKDNRTRTRMMMESDGAENKKITPASDYNRFARMRIDVDNDPIEMMDVNDGGRGAVMADSRSGVHQEMADEVEVVWDARETSVKMENRSIKSNSRQ